MGTAPKPYDPEKAFTETKPGYMIELTLVLERGTKFSESEIKAACRRVRKAAIEFADDFSDDGEHVVWSMSGRVVDDVFQEEG